MALGRVSGRLPLALNGELPPAKIILDDLVERFGNGFTKSTGSIFYQEQIALALFQNRILKASNDLIKNLNPTTADVKIVDWAEVFGININSDSTLYEIQKLIKLKLDASRSNNKSDIYNIIKNYLPEDVFVDLYWFDTQDFETDNGSYWIYNPGGNISFNGNEWISNRATMLILVDKPDNMSIEKLNELMNVNLSGLINNILPIWADYSWQLGDTIDQGFVIGDSLLNYNVL